jgi:hypothetical protein
MSGAGDIAASHHAAISRRQAAASGLEAPRIRTLKKAGLLAEPVPGVLVYAGAPPTWRQGLAVIALAVGGIAVIAYRCAAALHRLDGFVGVEFDPEVIVPRGALAHVRGIIRHQVSEPVAASDRVVIDGLPCTGLARTIVDLANIVTDDELERVIDDFERRGASLTWLEQTARRLARRGCRGPGRVIAEVRRRRVRGTVRGSWFERLIEDCVKSSTLPELCTQFEIRDDVGDFVARVDLAIPSVKVGIEAHSRSFHTGEHRELVDQRRENRALLLGWQFLYLGWADRRTPQQARRYLERLVARRRVDLGLTG